MWSTSRAAEPLTVATIEAPESRDRDALHKRPGNASAESGIRCDGLSRLLPPSYLLRHSLELKAIKIPSVYRATCAAEDEETILGKDDVRASHLRPLPASRRNQSGIVPSLVPSSDA